MDFSSDMKKYYVQTRVLLGCSPAAIFSEMVQAWGEDHISRKTVYNYAKEFKPDGRVDNGRPISTRMLEGVDRVQELVSEDPKMTIDEIAVAVDLSHGSVFSILHTHLGLRSYCSKWIPYKLSEEDKEKRVKAAHEWIHHFRTDDSIRSTIILDEKQFFWRTVGNKRSNRCWAGNAVDKTRIVRTNLSSRKSMALVAVTFGGKHFFEVFGKNQTMDSDVYISSLRRMMHNFSRHTNPLTWTSSTLIHDNARPHTSRATTTFLEGKGAKLLYQPP